MFCKHSRLYGFTVKHNPHGNNPIFTLSLDNIKIAACTAVTNSVMDYV